MMNDPHFTDPADDTSRKKPLPGTPGGLSFLYTAGSVPEAEMLTQVLLEAGFHIEYVSPVTVGIFGITGNNVIYVAENEHSQAAEFLRDYLNPPAIPE